MGAAIEVFEGARALRVPRERFAPVKTTDDLLALRSDCLRADRGRTRGRLARTRRAAARREPRPRPSTSWSGFDARFPAGPPSLVGCRRFTVRGDVTFGSGVVARGNVELDTATARSRSPTAPSSRADVAAR